MAAPASTIAAGRPELPPSEYVASPLAPPRWWSPAKLVPFRIRYALQRRRILREAARRRRRAEEILAGIQAAQDERLRTVGKRAQRRQLRNATKPGEAAMRAQRREVRIAKRKAKAGYERGHARKREHAAIARMTPPAELRPTSVERFVGWARWWWGTRWLAELMRGVSQ